MSNRPAPRTATATGVVAAMTVALVLAGAGPGHAAPGAPGVPGPAPVVFHEDFEQAPDTGRRTMLPDYVSATGAHYTADPYWIDNVKANGMVLSWDNTAYPADGTGAQNGTQETAFNTLRQLAEAIGRINGTPAGAARTNTVISAYTQSTGTPPPGGQVMFRTVEDIALADAQGRFLAFSMSAAATNAKNPAATGAPRNRENPQLMLFVDRAGVETPLTTTPIDPLTDPRSVQVDVTALTPGSGEAVRAGRFASDRSFLYEGGEFGVVVRNMTSAHLGNDGAFDDITILDVTPQLDKEFAPAHAVTGAPVRLTFTVTNTAELAGKQGWAFTDALPAGLVVAAEPNLVVDGAATVVAEPGGTTIGVTGGDLAPGDHALTISVDVTAAVAGTYVNGAADIVVRRGLDAPGSATVTFEDPAPVPADLVVRYVDESGTPVADGYTTHGAVGDPYSTAPVDVPGYELVALPANQDGTLQDGTTEVVYVYRPAPAPVPGEVVVRHVDQDGREIAPSERTEGAVDEPYGTSPADVPGYTLVETPGNASGRYTDGSTEVVYVYRKDPPPAAPADLIVRWVTEDGTPLADEYRGTGVVGEPYTSERKSFDGYTLVAMPANAAGDLTASTTEVVYVYRADPPADPPAEPVVPPVDPPADPPADPVGPPADPVAVADLDVPPPPAAREVVHRSGVLAAGGAERPRPAALATTGSAAGPLGGLALALALTGAALVLARRRGHGKEV